MNRASREHVAIVLVNYNGLEDTLRCLDSLRRLPSPRPTVILVDNGSRIRPAASADACYAGLVQIENETNEGFAGGNNRGIERALSLGADFLLILNNDTTVAPSIVDDLLEAFERRPEAGIIGPVINYLDEPDRVMTDGVRFNPGPGPVFFERLEVPVDQVPPHLASVDIVNGCCMMVRADVLRRIGGFDETFFIIHEESDLCLRVREHGIECLVLGRSLVWHKGSSSFERSGRCLQRYYDTRNLYRLVRRHAGRTPGSRRFLASLPDYLRYAYYRYAIEMEAGKTEAAEAVLDGLYDAVRGVTGPYGSRPRTGRALLTRLADFIRRRSRSDSCTN